MFCVIYQWKVKPGMTQQFREAWHAITESIVAHHNSFGSRLHEADDGTWVAYAQWRDREHWESLRGAIAPDEAHRRLAESTDGPATVLFKLVVTDDLLRYPVDK